MRLRKCKEPEQQRFTSACATQSRDGCASLSRSCLYPGVWMVFSRFVQANLLTYLCADREYASSLERSKWNVEQTEDGMTERHRVKLLQQPASGIEFFLVYRHDLRL